MRIEEVCLTSIEDILQENITDDPILIASLNGVMIRMKKQLEKNKNGSFKIEQVFSILDRKTDYTNIDAENDERKPMIIDMFNKNGMDISNTGKITLQNMGNGKPTDVEQQEKDQKSKEIAGKAMDDIRKKSENGEAGL